MGFCKPYKCIGVFARIVYRLVCNQNTLPLLAGPDLIQKIVFWLLCMIHNYATRSSLLWSSITQSWLSCIHYTWILEPCSYMEGKHQLFISCCVSPSRENTNIACLPSVATNKASSLIFRPCTKTHKRHGWPGNDSGVPSLHVLVFLRNLFCDVYGYAHVLLWKCDFPS